MKFQVTLNQNGQLKDLIVEATNSTEAKIITKKSHPKSKVIGVAAHYHGENQK